LAVLLIPPSDSVQLPQITKFIGDQGCSPILGAGIMGMVGDRGKWGVCSKPERKFSIFSRDALSLGVWLQH
jgi:hypothetical protein